jgi:hypothetical protein
VGARWAGGVIASCFLSGAHPQVHTCLFDDLGDRYVPACSCVPLGAIHKYVGFPTDQSIDNILIIIPMCILVLCVLLVFKCVLESFLDEKIGLSSLVQTFRIPIGLIIFLLESAVNIMTQLLATLFSRYLLTLPPNGVGSSAVTEVLPIAVSGAVGGRVRGHG